MNDKLTLIVPGGGQKRPIRFLKLNSSKKTYRTPPQICSKLVFLFLLHFGFSLNHKIRADIQFPIKYMFENLIDY